MGREQPVDASPGGRSRLLLIDTCGAEGSVALAEGGDVVAAETLPGRSASERLLPALRAMLERRGWRIGELAAIAVVHGPGSFTGLRVGVSAAKGLSEGGDVPLIAISRLAVLAELAGAGRGRVHALLSAGRAEVFYGSYVAGRCEREDLLTMEAALGATAAGEGMVVVCEPGTAAAFAGARSVPEPTAAAALGIAMRHLRSGAFADVAALDGHYLRRTETEIRQRVEAHERARSGEAVG